MPTPLEERLATGADPEGALPRLERFLEAGGAIPADPDGAALLAAIFESGSLLSDFVLSAPGLLEGLRADPFLRRPKPRGQWMAEARAAADGARDLADLERRLRLYRRREILRLGARELGWGDTLEVARELSHFADACLDVAVAFCDAELRAAHGAPTSPEGTPSFVVLAMGKLGGEELNFSSDIDVIYLYSTDEGAAGALTLHEYYARLSQMVTRALSEITGEGAIFRVDLRLRPEGRSGAICNSLAAAERYYETFGRTWERQALLRARPCAGDLALGERFLRIVEPFVYPRSIGPGFVDDVRALRRMFRETAGGPAFDVKLDAGGSGTWSSSRSCSSSCTAGSGATCANGRRSPRSASWRSPGWSRARRCGSSPRRIAGGGGSSTGCSSSTARRRTRCPPMTAGSSGWRAAWGRPRPRWRGRSPTTAGP